MIPPAHNASRPGSEHVLTDHVHAHLEKIQASSLFAGTRRLKSVLRYLVLQALNGTSAGLSEYRIALEAFDKSESFDPTTDPIVRVEMSRLRTRLARYYDEYIVDDGIAFELPRGTYALSIRSAPAGGTRLPSRDSSTMTIGVSLLHAVPRTRAADVLCVQLARELVEILGNEPYLSTVVRAGRRPEFDFVVEGSIHTWSPLVYATMRLIDVRRGAVHVLGHYVYEIQKTFTLHMDLPSAIVADIRSHFLASRNGSGPQWPPLGSHGAGHGRRERPAGMSDTIVQAAIETFAQCGYFGATLNAIALRARVADGFVLDLFGNKVVLFIESMRTTASHTLDLPHLEQLLTVGETKGKTLQGALLGAISRWYSTLSIERARLSIYSGLTENTEYQHLIHDAIDPIMRHLTRSRAVKSVTGGTVGIDLRAAAQSLVVFLIYFRVAPWSPQIKEAHDQVAELIVKQSIECLFGGWGH